MMSETVKIDKINYGFGLSLAIVSVINGFLTIGKEVASDIFKEFAIAVSKLVAFDHHWVGHAVIIFVLFLVFGLVFSQGVLLSILLHNIR